MCGICGIYDNAGARHAVLRDMTQALAHRGPDDEGFYVCGPIGLGYRRLSIIDLVGGQQPICNEDRSVWIVYNGEIYNYRALRDQLEARGHIFATHSDTEVVVHLYEEFGEGCVEHLHGMFAFAIWDGRGRRLMLARDRLGQKPLFYARSGETLVFASEVKAILAHNELGHELDVESLHDYLSLRFIPAPRTMFRHVSKLPPGHYLILEDGMLRTRRYWSVSFRSKLALTEEECIESLRTRLTETVGSHLVSDVPVGAFLSGGMDSSMIVALMAGQTDAPFKTFAIGVKEQDFDELPYARMVAQRYATEHIEQVVASDLIPLLPTIIWHLDEPSDPIAACMFHAAALAGRHVKVVLGGDGGDELFAGFDRYRGLGAIDYYSLIPSLVRTKLIAPIVDAVPDSFTYKSLAQRMRWVQRLAALPSNGERYAEATAFFRFTHDEKRTLFGDALWREVGHVRSSCVIVDQFQQAEADDLIDRMLYADLMTRLPEHSLMLTDRMTMAHSLEARSPFLDHRLVEFLASIPSTMKIRGRTLKYVLRKLAQAYLPASIVRRQKQGFMFPIAYWFRNELRIPLRRFLIDSSLVRDGVFKQAAVLKLVEDHQSNRVDNHVRLWMLLNLEVWHQIYIARKSLVAIEEQLREYFGP